MTFKEQLEDDLEVFFNLEEFAETVTYDPDDGSGARQVVAVLSTASGSPGSLGGGPGIHSDAGILYVKVSEVPSPEYRDKFVIQGETWRVFRDPDKGRSAKRFGGVWVVTLTKDERFKGYGYQ